MFNNASTYGATLQIEGTTYNNASASIVMNSTSNYPVLYLARSRGTTVGSNTIVTSGDIVGDINFEANDGSEFVEVASIQAVVDGTPGANDMPGRLVFSTTADGASSPTERMRIKNDGRIIVGDSGAFGTVYGMKITAAKTGASGTYFSIGDDGNNSNAYSRDSGTTTYAHITFANGNGLNGSITTNGTSTAYNTTSDYRLKENLAPLTGAVDRLQQIPVHRFNFIADPDKTVDGFLAHEAQEIVPECVTGEKDAVDDDGNPVYQGIDQSKLVPLLTAALQEAIAKIEDLEGRLTAAGL
jgi:hypothetical protein